MEIEEQHPIPQQVSSYQFKLVGDMTLQQFFQVAGGALIALLFYSSNLPSYVKWPLIILSFLTGIALAFFPLEDRPLAKWIVLFVKAIYSPTIYVWKQKPAKFSYFQPETAQIPAPSSVQPAPVQPSPKPTSPQISDKLESEEKKFLDKVTKDLEVLPIQPVPTIAGISPQKKVEKPQINVPSSDKVAVELQTKPQVQVEHGITQASNYKLSPSAGQKVQNVKGARFSSEASPPLPPTKANIIVGQVVDSEGKIVENAILEIRDSEGRPARALRSNKLGHFMIVTPLANGIYQITTEKEGLIFDTLSLNVKGEIIPPIAIWAKGKMQTKLPVS